jgi:hypothetical protein
MLQAHSHSTNHVQQYHLRAPAPFPLPNRTILMFPTSCESGIQTLQRFIYDDAIVDGLRSQENAGADDPTPLYSSSKLQAPSSRVSTCISTALHMQPLRSYFPHFSPTPAYRSIFASPLSCIHARLRSTPIKLPTILGSLRIWPLLARRIRVHLNFIHWNETNYGFPWYQERIAHIMTAASTSMSQRFI